MKKSIDRIAIEKANKQLSPLGSSVMVESLGLQQPTSDQMVYGKAHGPQVYWAPCS